jgi:divalent metal cation (Fe/Co/Zn/Cd) transporter
MFSFVFGFIAGDTLRLRTGRTLWGFHPIASARISTYRGVVMFLAASNYLVPAGFRLAIQAAVLVIAVIAARRYKLNGLWILVAAVFLTVFQDVMGLVSFSLISAGRESAMTNSAWLQYVPWVTMVLVLCGWCVLAFSRKQGAKPA